MIFNDTLLILFYFLFPVIIIFLCQKIKIFNIIGSVVLAYIIGLIIGNSDLLPDNANKIQDLIITITIPLSIPLLLFSANISNWFKIAGKTMLSMILELISIILIISSGYFIFMEVGDTHLWKVSGMLIGTYSGGTPNLASLKIMLNVDANTFIKTHTYDLIFSTLYLAFLITFAHRIFSLILPKYKFISKNERSGKVVGNGEDYTGIFKKKIFLYLLAALLISCFIVFIGWVISKLLPSLSQMVVVILSITTLGIVSSFIPFLNKIEKTFELGMYFILVFCLTVASMADLNNLVNITPKLFYYVGYSIFGSLILHMIFARIFKIDTDTFMITSAALICSPPFVPMVASAIKNRQIIISGLTVGIVGYAIGNYLGVLISGILKVF